MRIESEGVQFGSEELCRVYQNLGFATHETLMALRFHTLRMRFPTLALRA